MATMNDTREMRILDHAEAYARKCARIEAIVTAGMDEMGRWYWGLEFRRLGLETLMTLEDARPLTDAELYSLARQARMTIEKEMEAALRAITNTSLSRWQRFAGWFAKWGWR